MKFTRTQAWLGEITETTNVNIPVNDAHSWNTIRGIREFVCVFASRCFLARSTAEFVPPSVRRNATSINLEFYARDIVDNNDNDDRADDVLRASFFERGARDGRCEWRLTNYNTQIDLADLLVNSGDANGVGARLRCAAFALLRGLLDCAITVFTSDSRIDLHIGPDNVLTANVRVPVDDVDDIDGAIADPSLHTTVVLRWRNRDDYNDPPYLTLFRVAYESLYAPILRHGDAYIVLLPSSDSLSSIFSADFAVRDTGKLLPFAMYCDPSLDPVLYRGHSHLSAHELALHLMPLIAMVFRDAVVAPINRRFADALYEIIAISFMRDIERMEDASACTILTAFDFLVTMEHCCRWIVAQFRARHRHQFPCADEADTVALVKHRGLTAVRVSRRLLRILTAHPEVDDFWPLDNDADQRLLVAPIWLFMDEDVPPFLATLVALINQCLTACGFDVRVRCTIAHVIVDKEQRFVLDATGAFHCPVALLHKQRARALAEAYKLAVRMPQISACMPSNFHDIMRPFIADLSAADQQAAVAGAAPNVVIESDSSENDIVNDNSVEESTTSLVVARKRLSAAQRASTSAGCGTGDIAARSSRPAQPKYLCAPKVIKTLLRFLGTNDIKNLLSCMFD
jgi:hypothetical protein